MSYLRPYSVLSWMKQGTKPPYPYAFRNWGAYHSTGMGPNPPLRPSPGRRAVTAMYVESNSLVTQDFIGLTFARAGGSPVEQRVEFEVDGGGSSGSEDVLVQVSAGDSAVQVRDKLAAALAAEGDPYTYCYARDIVAGDAYQSAFGMPAGPYLMVVDCNKGPLEITPTPQWRTHLTQNITHGSMHGGITNWGGVIYAGEYEVLGLCARWGFNRAAMPGPQGEIEYLWQV